MLGIIKNKILFNNIFCFNRNRGININYFSNFERGGLYFRSFTVNNNCIKRQMAKLKNSFIFFNKFFFFTIFKLIFEIFFET